MPELPEVETVCRALRPHLLGARIRDVAVHAPKLRRRLDPEALRRACAGRTVRDLRRRAKYLVLELDDRHALILHLGMTGEFRVVPEETPLEKHARVVWTLDGGRSWRFLDPRMFGEVTVCRLPAAGADPAELGRLGVEPLSPAFSGDILWTLTRGRQTPVKTLLMQQQHLAGVGNIYASEACFRAGIRPQRPAGRLTRAGCARLAAEVRTVLSEAIRAGGTTISDFRSVDGSEGRFNANLQAYGRDGEPCRRCGAAHRIRRLVLAGRSTFYCPHCQT